MPELSCSFLISIKWTSLFPHCLLMLVVYPPHLSYQFAETPLCPVLLAAYPQMILPSLPSKHPLTSSAYPQSLTPVHPSFSVALSHPQTYESSHCTAAQVSYNFHPTEISMQSCHSATDQSGPGNWPERSQTTLSILKGFGRLILCAACLRTWPGSPYGWMFWTFRTELTQSTFWGFTLLKWVNRFSAAFTTHSHLLGSYSQAPKTSVSALHAPGGATLMTISDHYFPFLTQHIFVSTLRTRFIWWNCTQTLLFRRMAFGNLLSMRERLFIICFYSLSIKLFWWFYLYLDEDIFEFGSCFKNYVNIHDLSLWKIKIMIFGKIKLKVNLMILIFDRINP